MYSNKKITKGQTLRIFDILLTRHYKNVYQVSFCYEFFPGFGSYFTTNPFLYVKTGEERDGEFLNMWLRIISVVS